MIPALDRRALLRAAARFGARGALTASAIAAVGGWVSRRPAPPSGEAREAGILRPPGALPEEDFLAACIRCDLCADACPRACLRLFGAEAGRVAGTPYLVPAERACNLCLECTRACPSGALEELADSADARMGIARVDERLCVSINGTGVCGACHTACPFRNRAIVQGAHNAPTVVEDACVGCGLCEEACIVHDRKAIRVFSPRRYA